MPVLYSFSIVLYVNFLGFLCWSSGPKNERLLFLIARLIWRLFGKAEGPSVAWFELSGFLWETESYRLGWGYFQAASSTF